MDEVLAIWNQSMESVKKMIPRITWDVTKVNKHWGLGNLVGMTPIPINAFHLDRSSDPDRPQHRVKAFFVCSSWPQRRFKQHANFWQICSSRIAICKVGRSFRSISSGSWSLWSSQWVDKQTKLLIVGTHHIYNLLVSLAFTAERQEMKRVYDTANFYHFVHSLALFAVPLARRPALVSFQ